MAEENDSISSEKLISALRTILTAGREEVRRVGSQSKQQIGLRSLKKDRSKMYEKLGKEVEQLMLSGDVVHPGLQRGFDRLQELHATIAKEEE